MNKIKIAALFGPSGSGKNYIKKWILSQYEYLDLKNIIPCTTRPKREGEVEGQDYYFIDKTVFSQKVLDGSIVEARFFNNWGYGTFFSELNSEKTNIGIFTVDGIECLLTDNRLEVLPIYIQAEDKIRLKRSLEREESPDCREICRRFLADQKDFMYIPFDYINFNNNIDYNKTLQLPQEIKNFMVKNKKSI